MLSYQKLDNALLNKINKEKSFSKNFIDFVEERNKDCHLYDSFLSSNPVVDISSSEIFNINSVGIPLFRISILLGIMLCGGLYFNNIFISLISGIFTLIYIVLYCVKLLVRVIPVVCYKCIQKGYKYAILEGIEMGMPYKDYLKLIK